MPAIGLLAGHPGTNRSVGETLPLVIRIARSPALSTKETGAILGSAHTVRSARGSCCATRRGAV